MASETEQKHTPGPWTAYEGWKEGGRVAMHPRWCEVVGGSHSDFSYISISGHFGLANARLIAAAPDMLDALKAFVQANQPIEDYNLLEDEAAARRLAVAAIAKASA